MQIRTAHLFRRRLVLRRLSDNYLGTDIERFLPHLQLDEAILFAIDARNGVVPSRSSSLSPHYFSVCRLDL